MSGLVDHFYSATAKLLNCEVDEIAFVENATRAWDMAFYSFNFSPGDKILTTLVEYGSNVIAYNQQVQRYGVELIFVPNDEFGQIDIQALENLIDDRVKLISLSHIPTGGGLVNPAGAVGRIAQSANIPFLLDATQSVGQLPLDVDKIGCDILCGAGRCVVQSIKFIPIAKYSCVIEAGRGVDNSGMIRTLRSTRS
ncbi:MAG: aminotransferase class V-fold PLP-dependent enzyme [Anaerolineales bacterium]|nr:aminotransferase class V-fold PLP-dependent enzyme [Anaerolineales bacterium]